MKTPRTILLARHRGIDPRLDAVREQVVASLVPPPAPAASPSPAASPAEWRVRRARAATGLWLELQLLAGSIRWHLAGLAALWIAAAVLSSLDPAARSDILRSAAGYDDQPVAFSELIDIQIGRASCRERV